jgi:CTP synthase
VHPYYVATQAHPELLSRPTRAHPLFAGLIAAAVARQRELEIPVGEAALRRSGTLPSAEAPATATEQTTDA